MNTALTILACIGAFWTIAFSSGVIYALWKGSKDKDKNLRDNFAMASIKPALDEAIEAYERNTTMVSVYARAADGAYKMADAMMYARAGGGE